MQNPNDSFFSWNNSFCQCSFLFSTALTSDNYSKWQKTTSKGFCDGLALRVFDGCIFLRCPLCIFQIFWHIISVNRLLKHLSVHCNILQGVTHSTKLIISKLGYTLCPGIKTLSANTRRNHMLLCNKTRKSENRGSIWRQLNPLRTIVIKCKLFPSVPGHVTWVLNKYVRKIYTTVPLKQVGVQKKT